MIKTDDTVLASDLYCMREYMGQKGIMFCFTGYMSEAILTGLASAVRQKLEIEQTDQKTAKGLFSIFVELVQNVIRYSSEMDVHEDSKRRIDLRYGVITVGKQDDGYFVACGNMIQSEDVQRLSEGLTAIAALDKEGLKALYKKTLKEPAPQKSKGAGVGFIEIARQAKDGFEFDFQTVDGAHSFFAIRAKIIT